MRKSLMYLAQLSLLAAFGGCLGLLAGCDNPTHHADKKVQEQLNQAQTQSDAAASKALESASADPALSSAAKAQSLAALGQVELASANAKRGEIDGREVEVARLVLEMHQIGMRVAAINTLIEGYRKQDPKAVIDSVEQKKSEAQGSAEKTVWFDTDKNAKLPTLSAVKQETSRLEGEVAKTRQAVANLTDQRTRILDEAETADRASQGKKGQESVDEYKKGADLRKQAADLANQIEVQNLALVPLLKDLGIAQVQQAAIMVVIKEFEDQIRQNQNTWAEIQQQINDQQSVVKALVTATGEPPKRSATTQPAAMGSIAGKAAEMAELIKKSQADADAADKAYTSAAKHFDEAVKAANEYVKEIKTRINDPKLANLQERAAWQQSLEAINPQVYRFHAAEALVGRAALHMGRAMSLASRIKLTETLAPIVQASGLTMAKELDTAGMPEQLTAARKTADVAFSGADSLLKTVAESGASSEARRAANTERIFVLWSWAQLADDVNDASGADRKRSEADSIRKTLGDIPGLVFPGTPAKAAESKAAPAAPEPAAP